MNEYIWTEEDEKQSLKDIESFKKEMTHLLDEEINEDDLSNVSKKTKTKILHLNFLEQQSRELIDLQNNGASESEIDKLIFDHSKKEDEFLCNLYSSKKITENDVKVIQAKKHLSPKELSILYPRMSISSQATFRGRLKDKLPYHQATKRGKITYIVEEVELWMDNNNIR